MEHRNPFTMLASITIELCKKYSPKVKRVFDLYMRIYT